MWSWMVTYETSYQQSVNSLLLSVRNLENFNKKPESELDKKQIDESYTQNPNIILKSNFYDNYLSKHETGELPIYEYRWQMLQNIRNIHLPPVGAKQEKEADEISTTSSLTTTNFTGKHSSHLHWFALISTHFNSLQLFPSTTHIKDWINPKRSAAGVTRSRFSSSSWRFCSPLASHLCWSPWTCGIRQCRADKTLFQYFFFVDLRIKFSEINWLL